MRLTSELCSPPVFRFWKHFGAGVRKRQPNFKQWKHAWYANINRRKVPDHTIPKELLPPGSRVMEAEELLDGPIEALPDELIKRQKESFIYDHPWPFDAKLDPVKNQQLMYCYNIDTRFFVPRDDCLVLTNTVLDTEPLEAYPPLEPSAEHMDYLRRHYEWVTEKDSVLARLPKSHVDWPKVNIKPVAAFGLTQERKESNLLNVMSNYAQTLLTRHYHERSEKEKLKAILNQRSLAYPHCQVPFERESGKMMNLDLYIDSMLISKEPLPQIELEPSSTKQLAPLDIKPRTWRAILEQSRNYSQSWSFTLPRNAHLHTIYLNAHIKRHHRDVNEMLARSVVHAFGIASQFARLQAHAEATMPATANSNSPSSTTTDFHKSCILQDPLAVKQVNDKDLLDKPVVLQTISYDHNRGEFDFMRYQLNTLNFDDSNPARVKNLAWHSGPISDLDRALRYYLDFQAFDAMAASRMMRMSSARGDSGHETDNGAASESLGA